MENIIENQHESKKPVQPGLVLGLIALLGVIILFILHFTGGSNTNKTDSLSNMPLPGSENNKIVFVNTDSILHGYELVDELTTQLESERDRKNADFSQRQKSYEEDAAYFQSQVEKQAISESSAQQIYEKLMLQQQDLYKLQDQYAAELSRKEYEMNMVLLDSIKNYLVRLNKTYQFDYILSSNNTGNILFAKDTFDITSQVLTGLNSEYREKMNR